MLPRTTYVVTFVPHNHHQNEHHGHLTPSLLPFTSTTIYTPYSYPHHHPRLLHPLSLFHSEFNGGKCSQPKSISSSPSVCLWGTIRQRAYPLRRPSNITGVPSTILNDREDSSSLMQIALSRMKRHRTLWKYFTLRVCIVLGNYFFVIHFAFKFVFTIKAMTEIFFLFTKLNLYR